MRIEHLESRLLLCDCTAHTVGQLRAQTVVSDAPVADASASAAFAPSAATSAPQTGQVSEAAFVPASAEAASADVAPAAVGDQLLPDMFPLVSQADGYVYGWTYDVAEQPGHILLRLSTAMANRGRGAMELNGGAALPNGSQEVYQRIYLEGGGSTTRLAGTFTYHPSHEHIHFDNFAAYRLRGVTAGNGVGSVAAEGEKISFCLLDVDHFAPTLPGSPILGLFVSCGQTQGVSVGWADVYDQSLPDQWIDVTNVPDGQYWLEVQADPDNHLLESDETNNTVRIQINLDKPSPHPAVVEQDPTGQYPSPVSSIDFLFDQPMNPASFGIADDVVSFTGPAGAELRGQITGSAWTDNRTVRVSFNTQTAIGPYSMTIGPGILAADDNAPMDQDRDKTPGENPQDRYTAAFSVDNRVGPDAFGYDARAVPVENVDLVRGAPGVVLLVDNVDDGYAAVSLGSNKFNFYGVNYTGNSSLFVNSNGLITLGSNNAAYKNQDLTNDPAQPTLAPLWDDWRTDQSANDAVLGKFEDTTGDGVPDRLIVEWNDVRRHSDPGLAPAVDVTFQAILSLNTGSTPGAIVFNYRDIDTGSAFSNGADATVGIKAGGDQTVAGSRLLISRDSGTHPFVASGRAIRISRAPAEIVGRHLFYNHSTFDGDNASANWQDDAAVAPDKTAYGSPPTPGGALATFANVSGYSRGLNGVIVDIAGLFGKTPVATDFEFRTGDDVAGAWTAAPAPTLSIRRNAGAGGSDRLTFVWPDNAIRNTWLRVTVKPSPNTGLTAADVFYFGHLAGETGDPSPSAGASVTVIDVAHTRGAASAGSVGLSDRFDHNRDGRVDALDLTAARSNQQATLRWLELAPTASSGNSALVSGSPPVLRDSPTHRSALLLDDAPPVL